MDTVALISGLGAAAAILFVAGAAILLTSPQERSASDLLADDAPGTARRERGEGLILRRLLPPAPAFVLERSDLAALERRLREAGRPYGFTATEFVRFRLLSAVLVAVIALLLFSGSDPLVTVVVAAAFGAGGYALPQLWLSGVAQGRTKQLNGALPDMVDSLALALDAGMDLEAAVRRVGPKQQGPLGEAFADVLAELSAGYSLTQALERLAARTTSNALGDLVSLIQQSRRLGVGLASNLRVRAEEMRALRRIKAHEEAQRAPLKMTIPLVLFFLPALMIVFLGPAILSFLGAK